MSKEEEKINSRRLRTSYITTVVSIALVLLMLGMLGMILLHAQKLSNIVKENIGFTIYMGDDVKESRILEFQKTLELEAFVKSTEYITKEQAAEELISDLGEDFIGFLGYNPLLPSIEVRLNAAYANTDSLGVFEEQLLLDDDVQEIFYQKSLVDLVNKNIRRIGLILIGFSVLLLIIAIALINNTIRLAVYAKRFLIKSMHLVGATQGFIRRPFLLRGIVQGLYGSMFAILMISLIIYLLRTQLPELKILQDSVMFLYLYIFVIASGLIIAWLSTYFAVRKYLRLSNDHLYH